MSVRLFGVYYLLLPRRHLHNHSLRSHCHLSSGILKRGRGTQEGMWDAERLMSVKFLAFIYYFYYCCCCCYASVLWTLTLIEVFLIQQISGSVKNLCTNCKKLFCILLLDVKKNSTFLFHWTVNCPFGTTHLIIQFSSDTRNGRSDTALPFFPHNPSPSHFFNVWQSYHSPSFHSFVFQST